MSREDWQKILDTIEGKTVEIDESAVLDIVKSWPGGLVRFYKKSYI
jgi:hypothetical protein